MEIPSKLTATQLKGRGLDGEAAEETPQPLRPVRFGRMVTGEAFLSGPGTEAVRSAFHPLCADMESAAVAHVCHANGIPFLSIRTITDSADRSAAACFEENCRRASEIAAQVTHALLKRLAVSESYPIEKGELP